MSLFSRYLQNKAGAVTVEAAILSPIMIVLTIGAFEICYGFFQWNTVQKSARIGARLAATTQPISDNILTMTGLEDGAQPGDPMPEYAHLCSGATSSCSDGGFNTAAFAEILYGPDNDGVCEKTIKTRQGICDIYAGVRPENLEIEYRNSGLGRAGNPPSPAPLITVTLKDIEFDFALVKYFTPSHLRTMPTIQVTVVAEDLQSGA